MRNIKQLFIFAVVIAAIIAGCKKDETPTNPGGSSVTYIGTLASVGETGSITLVFSSAPSKLSPHTSSGITTIITVSGSIKINNVTTNITGTYNTDTDSLYLSGGHYTFAGKYNNGQISGTFTNTSTMESGGFTAEVSGEGQTIKVYCGTYQETSPGTETGRFNLVVKGTVITGITQDGLELGGTLVDGHVSIHFKEYPTIEIATGTVQEDGSITGQYSVPAETGTKSGTWEAHNCQ